LEIPKVGITTLDELLQKTAEKKERDELALRLLIPKEVLIQWVEKAKLVQLKGLGVENLRILEEVGIHSISNLAREDPQELYEKIKQAFQGRVLPRKAKIRIWIREAQKTVRSEE
jgi:predicted RecB family nuclease